MFGMNKDKEIKYPTYIEVPEGYWTITTTICVLDNEEVDIHWHHGEDN